MINLPERHTGQGDDPLDGAANVCSSLATDISDFYARILAELALVDTDKALGDQGNEFPRFFDDFRLFLSAHQNRMTC